MTLFVPFLSMLSSSVCVLILGGHLTYHSSVQYNFAVSNSYC